MPALMESLTPGSILLRGNTLRREPALYEPGQCQNEAKDKDSNDQSRQGQPDAANGKSGKGRYHKGLYLLEARSPLHENCRYADQENSRDQGHAAGKGGLFDLVGFIAPLQHGTAKAGGSHHAFARKFAGGNDANIHEGNDAAGNNDLLGQKACKSDVTEQSGSYDDES